MEGFRDVMGGGGGLDPVGGGRGGVSRGVGSVLEEALEEAVGLRGTAGAGADGLCKADGRGNGGSLGGVEADESGVGRNAGGLGTPGTVPGGGAGGFGTDDRVVSGSDRYAASEVARSRGRRQMLQ